MWGQPGDRGWGISGGGQREENGHICNSVKNLKEIERLKSLSMVTGLRSREEFLMCKVYDPREAAVLQFPYLATEAKNTCYRLALRVK